MISWRRKTFEELPALSVRRRELRSALRIVTAGFMLFVVFFACTAGGHLRTYQRMLGFNDLAFGLWSAVPFVATFFLQLLAAVLIERRGLKKYQFIHCATWNRVLWLLIAALPLVLPIPSAWAVVLMLGSLGASSILGALAMPAWMTWMGDLIPRRIRGRYLANRKRLAEAIRIPAVIALGFLFDAVTDESLPETAAAQPVLLWTICAVIAVGAVFGVFDILLFYRIREVMRTTPDKHPPPAIDVRVPRNPGRGAWRAITYGVRWTRHAFGQVIFDPLKDPGFRLYVLHGATITFAAMVGGVYLWLNAMENLGFGNLAVNTLFLVLGPLSGIASARGWGRLIDRWGRRPVIVVCNVIICTSILPWFFVTRDTPAPGFLVDGVNAVTRGVSSLVGRPGWEWIGPDTPVMAYLAGVAACMVGAAAWGGIEVSRTSITMGFADTAGRSKYVAASSALISLGGLLGGTVGGVLTESLRFLQDSPITVGPFVWNNWHVAFAVSVLARMLALVWAIRMPDPGSGRVRDVVRVVGSNVYNNVRTRLFYPLRIPGGPPRGRRPKHRDPNDHGR